MRYLTLSFILGLLASASSETQKLRQSPSVVVPAQKEDNQVVISIFAPPWYDGWVHHFQLAKEVYAKNGIKIVPKLYVPIPEYVADSLVVNVLIESVSSEDSITIVYLSGLRGLNGERLAGVFLQTSKNQKIILMDFVSGSTTLAHEIGHYLGLGHTKDPGNIMCDCTRQGVGSFTKDQVSLMKKTINQPKPAPKSP
jgi:hypothetical protein